MQYLMDKEDRFREIITARDLEKQNGFHIACEQGEQIVKFCHGEAIPQEPTNIPKIFQVSSVLTYPFLKVFKFLGLKISGNEHANEFFFF